MSKQTSRLSPPFLSGSRVTFPLDLCHRPFDNLNRKRTKVADCRFRPRPFDCIMTRIKNNSKASFVVGGKRLAYAVAFDKESSMSKGRRQRSARLSGTDTRWPDQNDSLDASCPRALPHAQTTEHGRQPESRPTSQRPH